MVRVSRRKQFINEFESIVKYRRSFRKFQDMCKWRDDWENVLDDYYELKLIELQSSRYLIQKKKYKKRTVNSRLHLPTGKLLKIRMSFSVQDNIFWVILRSIHHLS